MILIIDTFDFLPFLLTFPIQFPASRRGVWFRVLCGGLRKHNRDRDEDSLSDKDTQYYYVDRAYFDFLLLRYNVVGFLID